MRFVDHTFDRPEDNLACDEALLDLASEEGHDNILRVWEPHSCFVVVGYANVVHREVNTAECLTAGIPVLRRCSGGGAVLQGPGCLNYALVLHIERESALRTISGANEAILRRHVHALQHILPASPEIRGHTDLVLNDRKFSGNSQRRKGQHLLFHGTLLYGFALDQIERFLPLPSVEPEYRQRRPHSSFVGNLDVSRNKLLSVLQQAWNVHAQMEDLPDDRIATLSRERYGTRAWTYRR
jgi:lipoate---protein ligase